MELKIICFRDKTFCSAKCGLASCSRQINQEVREAGAKWWGSEDFPIAVSDFSGICPDFIPMEEDNAGTADIALLTAVAATSGGSSGGSGAPATL